MWLRLKLAYRNVFRNGRRTALSILMIAGGFSTILLFDGLVHRMVDGLRETTIKTQTGHLQLAKTRFWKRSPAPPKELLIQNYESWIGRIKKNPHVTYAAGRLTFFCLLSKGEHSLSAQGVSFDLKAEAKRLRSFPFIQGKRPSKKNQIAVGSGLAKKLKIRAGDQIALLGQTYDGVMNGLDVRVSGIFQTAISEFDDSTFIIPLSDAQSLLDTRGVEQIVVGLDHTTSTAYVKQELSQRLELAQMGIQIKSWYWLATLYRQVSAFNLVQNRMFKLIILSLLLLSIMNTIGMSVAERTAEIGTVRAMGERSESVVLQFLLEGCILGLIGGAVGSVLGGLAAKGINALQIPIVMPGASTSFPLEIDFLWSSVQEGALICVLASMLAALIPAFRASRMNIIESLRRYV